MLGIIEYVGVGVWRLAVECELSNCESVPKNKWEGGSVSFQIVGVCPKIRGSVGV